MSDRPPDDRKSLTRDQVRELDRRAMKEYGLPGVVLMENAGRGCVLSLLAHGCRGPVVICCGKGNNGGDGFVMARHLDARGIPVNVLLLADPASLRGDAAANYSIAVNSGIRVQVVSAEVAAAEIDPSRRSSNASMHRPPASSPSIFPAD
jgi:NAD(P)H-hydrate epimerase